MTDNTRLKGCFVCKRAGHQVNAELHYCINVEGRMYSFVNPYTCSPFADSYLFKIGDSDKTALFKIITQYVELQNLYTNMILCNKLYFSSFVTLTKIYWSDILVFGFYSHGGGFCNKIGNYATDMT